MGRKVTPRKLLNYVVFIVVALMAYKVFFQNEKKKDLDQHEYYPRNDPRYYDPHDDPRTRVKGRTKHKDSDRVVKDTDENDEEDRYVRGKQKHQRADQRKKSDRDKNSEKDKMKSFEKEIHKDEKYIKYDGNVDDVKQDDKYIKYDGNVDDVKKGDNYKKHDGNVRDVKEGDNYRKHDGNKDGESYRKHDGHIEGGKEKSEKTKTKLKTGDRGDDVIHKLPTESAEEREARMRAERRKKLHKVEFELEWEDVQITKEKNERRKEFLKNIDSVKEDFDADGEDEHFHEHDDDLTIATAVWSDNFQGALQLVESVQRFLPNVEIGLFDIGMTDEERKKLKGLCRVTVHRTMLMHMPSHMQDLQSTLWRPFVLQMALSTYGHVIYISPERKLTSTIDFKGFLAQSRIGGVSIVGKQRDYSSFVVTHPDMYHYLRTDTKKLQRIKHVEITMIILHNTVNVRMRFMRWLYSCALEEWCIAPPGSSMRCDHRQHAHSRFWANCHRYDESAINILLATWHKYDLKHYVRRDTLTSPYDGHDVTHNLRYCDKRSRQGDL